MSSSFLIDETAELVAEFIDEVRNSKFVAIYKHLRSKHSGSTSLPLANLFIEELLEFNTAYTNHCKIEMLDAICDMLYVYCQIQDDDPFRTTALQYLHKAYSYFITTTPHNNPSMSDLIEVVYSAMELVIQNNDTKIQEDLCYSSNDEGRIKILKPENYKPVDLSKFEAVLSRGWF